MTERRLNLATVVGALIVSLTFSGIADPLRLAVVPPQDYQPTLAKIRAVESELGVQVRRLTPHEFVDPDVLTPKRFPLAVYAGGERYCFSVNHPGDGAEALLNYVTEGGILLVGGMCWPFYRPVDYRDGEWTRSDGRLPPFEGDADRELRQHMKRLGQDAAGNLNRFFGLNIAGKGTKQFERPPENITLIASEAMPALFKLPANTPFPVDGDQRFRPTSLFHGMPGVTIQPLLLAVGESGTQYGAAAAVVTHATGGTVVYVWGTLMDGPLGPTLLDGTLRLAAQNNRLANAQLEKLRAAQANLKTVRKQMRKQRQNLRDAKESMPAKPYLSLQTDYIDALCGRAERALMVQNTDVADTVLTKAKTLEQQLSRTIDACLALHREAVGERK